MTNPKVMLTMKLSAKFIYSPYVLTFTKDLGAPLQDPQLVCPLPRSFSPSSERLLQECIPNPHDSCQWGEGRGGDSRARTPIMVNVPPFSLLQARETCELLIPFQGLGADLITLSL